MPNSLLSQEANRSGHRGHLWFFLPLLVCLIYVLILLSPLSGAATVSHGYEKGNEIVNGMIVSIIGDDTDSLEQAHTNNAEYVVGVAVSDEESSLVISEGNDRIYVAAEGVANVYISTIDGDIEKGDQIAVSSIAGVGKKAKSGTQEKVIGIAKESFSGSTAGAEELDLEFAGKVYVGSIKAELLVQSSLNEGKDDDSFFLGTAAQTIIGKPVTVLQVSAATILVIAGFIVGGSILYGSIRGSFLSIGRNPLSANSIYKGMLRTSAISVAILLVSILSGWVVLAV